MRYIPNRIVKLYNKSSIWTRSFANTAYGFLKKTEKNELNYFGNALQNLRKLNGGLSIN